MATQHLNDAIGYCQTPVAVLTKRSVKKAGCVHSVQRQFDYEDLIRTIYTRNGYTPESHNVAPSSFPGEVMADLWWVKWNWKWILSERFDFLLSVSFHQCFILSPFIYSFILHSFLHPFLIGHQHYVILYGVSDIRPISASQCKPTRYWIQMKYYSQTQQFNICHPVPHISVKRTIIRLYFTIWALLTNLWSNADIGL